MVDRSPKVQGTVSNVLVNTLTLLFQSFFFFSLPKYFAVIPVIVEKLRNKDSWPQDLEKSPESPPRD